MGIGMVRLCLSQLGIDLGGKKINNKKMKTPQNIVISVTDSQENHASFCINPHSTLEDYKQLFTTILTFLTFHPDSIKDLFYEE
jgi:hypothetical protein